MFLTLHLRLTEQDESSNVSILTSVWLHSSDELQTLIQNMKFHIMTILINYVDFLKPLQKCMPGCITQEFMGKTRQQYVTLNCDLVNAKENLSEGMITIFQNKNKLVF